MDEVIAVVRDPVWGLISPLWFVILTLCVVAALWSRRGAVRLAATICIVATSMHREGMLGVFLRMVADYRNAHGGASGEFLDGARVMHAYAQATSIYSIGSAILLGVLAVVHLPRDGASSLRRSGRGASSVASSAPTTASSVTRSSQ